MSFIFFILFFVFLVAVIFLSLGASFLRLLFGGGNKHRQGENDRKEYYGDSSRSGKNSSQHKKVFRKDEGEYVDYEEIE